jgi:hypothetical protein
MSNTNNKSWGGHGSWSKMMDAKIKKEKANIQARNAAYIQNTNKK